MDGKNRGLAILFNIRGHTIFFLLVISPENCEVASFLIARWQQPLNNANNFRHSNGVLVMVILFSCATLRNLRLNDVFCE